MSPPRRGARSRRSVEETAAEADEDIGSPRAASTPGKMRQITMEEVRKHVTGDDGWLVYRNGVYDVTKFYPTHPGGRYLLMGLGRDATYLIESYHPLYAWKMLERYRIGKLSTKDQAPAAFQFEPHMPGGFYFTVKERVEKWMKEGKRNPQYHPAMGFKTLFILALVWGSWWMAMRPYPVAAGLWELLLWTTLLGVGYANVGINVQHDANHGAYSNRNWVRYIMSRTTDFVMGGSSYVWRVQHQLGHHNVTNIVGHDPDIRASNPDVRRILPQQHWYERYRWQIFYLPVLYGFLAHKWFFQDFVDYRNNNVAGVPGYRQDLENRFMFWVGKAVWLAWAVVLPLALLGTPVWQVAVVTFWGHFVFGLWLACMFQVSHVTDGADWFTEQDPHKMEWAVHQVRGSIDYGPASRFWNHMSGGLSHQIEHHLFPTISHPWYPEIAPIVESTCKEFGVKYTMYSGFWEALYHHFYHLFTLSEPPADYQRGRIDL